MSFKIVETFERGKRVLSTVPSEWEVNGTLYWPRTTSLSLQKDPLSVPDKNNWPWMPCTVKRRGFLSLKEALNVENVMSGASDTEDESHIRNGIQTSTPLIEKTNYPNKRKKISQPSEGKNNDSNCNYDYLFHLEKCADVPVKVHNSLTDIDEDHLQTPPGSYKVLYSQQVDNNSVQVSLNVLESRLNSIENSIVDIKNLVSSQFQSVHNTLSEIKILQQKLLSTAAAGVNEGSSKESNFDAIKEILKVDSKEALDSLEEKLKDYAFSTLFVEYMSQICGTSGKKVAKRCRYMVFDHLFDRKLIANCSWTGISRKEQKINFSQYENILECLYKVLKLADRNFERSDMKDACSGILHNSTSRLNHANQRKLENI